MTTLSRLPSNPFIIAKSNPSVREIMGNAELARKSKQSLVDLIGSMEILAGTAKEKMWEKEDKVIIATALYSDLCERFPDLTMQEVQMAFKNGVRKDYGEYYGLNIVTFNGWLKAFIADEKRAEALMEWSRSQDAEKRRREPELMPDSEARKEMIKMYREGKLKSDVAMQAFRNWAIMVHDDLKIEFPDDVMNLITEEAKWNVAQAFGKYGSLRVKETDPIKSMELKQFWEEKFSSVDREVMFLRVKKWIEDAA